MLVSIAYTCLATYPHTAISADQNTTAHRRESDHSNNEPWSDHSNNEPWVELMFVKRVACNYTVTYAANVLRMFCLFRTRNRQIASKKS